MRKHLVLWALGCGCGVLAFVSDRPLAQAKDTIIIAIPGTPQGVDLDRQSGPQTWTMAAQIIELGAEWKPTSYPYEQLQEQIRLKFQGLPTQTSGRSRWFRGLSRTAI
jgi:hypothetical protein